MKFTFVLLFFALVFYPRAASATSCHEYGADEYVTIANGISPDEKLAITTHGGGDLGYDNFHVYLTNALTGKKIGPLAEINQFLDTGANAYCAQWSKNSASVTIIYRIDRHVPLKAISYRFGKGRAFLITGPNDVNDEQLLSWQTWCQTVRPSPRVFGTTKAQ
jgi:hypothetical protein